MLNAFANCVSSSKLALQFCQTVIRGKQKRVLSLWILSVLGFCFCPCFGYFVQPPTTLTVGQ